MLDTIVFGPLKKEFLACVECGEEIVSTKDGDEKIVSYHVAVPYAIRSSWHEAILPAPGGSSIKSETVSQVPGMPVTP